MGMCKGGGVIAGSQWLFNAGRYTGFLAKVLPRALRLARTRAGLLLIFVIGLAQHTKPVRAGECLSQLCGIKSFV